MARDALARTQLIIGGVECSVQAGAVVVIEVVTDRFELDLSASGRSVGSSNRSLPFFTRARTVSIAER
jgi:hypothetical protein